MSEKIKLSDINESDLEHLIDGAEKDFLSEKKRKNALIHIMSNNVDKLPDGALFLLAKKGLIASLKDSTLEEVESEFEGFMPFIFNIEEDN